MHMELDRLASSKISAFQGKESRNNRLILESLALNGPAIKYGIFRVLKNTIENYPTISRRVDDLKRGGYIEAAGTRAVKVGNRIGESHIYGLTWRGFFASLAIENVRRNLLAVLEANSVLERMLPKSIPKRVVIDVLNNMFSKEELDRVVGGFLQGYLMAIPDNLESVKDAESVAYLVPAFIRSPNVWADVSKKDLSSLFLIEGFPQLLLDMIEKFETQMAQTLEAIRSLKGIIQPFVMSGAKSESKYVSATP